MDSIKSHLETLSTNAQGQTNFESWNFKLVLTLKAKDLYQIASGADVRPAGSATEATVSTWIKKDIEAQALIGLNVDSNIAKKISHCTTSKQMLDKLMCLYGTKTDVSIELLQRKFFSFEFDEGKSVIENVMEVCQIAEELSAENDPVREKWIMTKILSILPPRLAHFCTAWDNVSGNDRTMEKLITRLRMEEERTTPRDDQTASTSQSALTAMQRGKPTPKQGYKSDKPKVTCYKCGQAGHVKKKCNNKPCAKYIAYCKAKFACNECGKKGHFAKECPAREDKNNSNKPKLLMTIGLSTTEMAAVHQGKDNNEVWYQDCGASQHMTFRQDWFENLIEFEVPMKISIGDSTELDGAAVGDICLEAFDGESWQPVVLQNVLYVPKLNFNLFSVGQTLDKGYIQEADKNQSRFLTAEGRETTVIAERRGKLYEMKLRRRKSENFCLAVKSLRTWHERLAHQNIRYVRDVLNKKGIKYIDDWKEDYVCEGCVYGKQTRISHPRNTEIASAPLDLVHVDLGEMNVRSSGGAKYFLLFKDDYSHYRTVYFLKTKDEAVAKLDIYLKLVENQLGRRVKKLRSDNGLEIRNQSSKQLLEKLGVFHTVTNVETPEQNGRIEREMRTIVEAARSAIHANELNENLWAEAVNYSVFTINQTGKSTVEGKSPAELWFGRQVDPRKLRAFGTECYVLIPKQRRKKLDRKSEKGILVGYDLDSPCYRVLMSATGKIETSDNVVFKEENVTNTGLETNVRSEQEEETETEEENEEDEKDNEERIDERQPGNSPREEQPRRRVLRDREALKQPQRFTAEYDKYYKPGGDKESAMIGEVEDIPVQEALKDPEWKAAMQEEYNSLIDMDTWELVDCPKDVKPLTCRWVLREKTNGRKKARLVARGFEQKEGIDYSETFSPVARHESIRLLLSHAASEKMDLVPFDVKTAFLHGELDKELYMKQPEGFDDGTERVLRLKKSLYGLKQAPKKWNEKISEHLEELGLTNTDDDPCVYYNQDRSLMMTLFVDDGLVIGRKREAIFRLLEMINKRFEITYDKEVKKEISYLGMEIKVRPDGIFVSQPKYTQKILTRFNFEECNPVATPIDKGMVTDPDNFVNDAPVPVNTPYREAIGSLLYLATISRPDISYAVNFLSRHCCKPMQSDWKMVKRLFQYLKGTAKFGIHFNGARKMEAYTDSDYGGDTVTGKSTSGVLLMRGGPLLWYSQKQHCVATSTAEAEYRAAVSSIDDVCWVKRIALELEIIKEDLPIDLFVDNKSAIHMLQNSHDGKTNKGKKHVEISRKFVKEHVGKTVTLKHVRSDCQLADIFTKPLCKSNFKNIRCKIIKEEC